MILLIETATPVCSVALIHNGDILGEIHSDEPNAHSSKLSVFIEQLLKTAHVKTNELNAVCVSSGPGSYTGLRIGVSSAKGLCYALDIPLLAVPTLEAMAAGYYAANPDYKGLACPMIDARRMECYTAIYDAQLHSLKEVSADIVEAGVYDDFLNKGPVVFVGDGAAKTQPVLGSHENARYDAEYRISAVSMGGLAESRFNAHQYEDVAYFEPFYLKDFVAKKSIVRGLR